MEKTLRVFKTLRVCTSNYDHIPERKNPGIAYEVGVSVGVSGTAVSVGVTVGV